MGRLFGGQVFTRVCERLDRPGHARHGRAGEFGWRGVLPGVYEGLDLWRRLKFLTFVIDRRNGATDDRRYGASLKG